MSSPRGALLGVQEPRVAKFPKFTWSHADDASFLAASYGLTPDEWQLKVLEAWLGERPAGKWSAGQCGLSVPRQNGKNGVLEVRELYGMIALGEKFLHTAHEVKTAQKHFRRMRYFFGEKADDPTAKFPELNALVTQVRNVNGQEAIFLSNGGSIEFVARSRGSGRGYTVDVLVVDEAQEYTDEQQEALMPTISAAPLGNPQTIYTGTPPGPGSPGTVFLRVRTQGVAGTSKRLAWHEWSVDGQVDVRDRALWAATNPALGIRLNLTVVMDELDAMSEGGFARERLGRWDEGVAEPSVIPRDTWVARGVEEAPTGGIPSFGVKFSPDGSTVALSAARKSPDGSIHVELIARRSMGAGLGWLVEWLAGGDSPRWRTAAAIVVDGKAHAGLLVAELRKARVPAAVIVTPTTDQVTTAHAALLEAVKVGSVTVLDHPGQSTLVDSIAASGLRPIGTAGGWGFRPLGGGECTSAESAVMAHWGAKASRRVPGRKQRVVVG